MPRKKDGMEVDFRPGLKKDADGKPLLYVAPKKGRNKTLAEIDDRRDKLRGVKNRSLPRDLMITAACSHRRGRAAALLWAHAHNQFTGMSLPFYRHESPS